MRVGLLHPGEMGAAIGAMLVECGHVVLWLPQDRSEQTARRAAAAGLTGAEDLRRRRGDLVGVPSARCA